MALGAIVNANNAFLPPDFNPTLNHRFVYRPYFGMVDTEKKMGKLTLTYATQIHACVVEIDQETGVTEIVDYAAVDDCGTRIHPQIVEGQVHGATAHAIGAALHEDFVYDEDGQLLTSNFYDYHVPHALDVPALKTAAIESPSPFSPLGAKGMGEGGGGGIHCIGSAIQDALKPAGRPIVYDELQPVPPRLGDAAGSGEDARKRDGGVGMKVEGTKELSASRDVVWQVLNDPAQMAKLMPGVEGFEIQDDRHWRAKVKIPLGLGGLRMTIDFEKVEERAPEFAQLNAKGNGVGAIMNMQTQFHLAEAGTGTSMRWEADVKIAGPVGAMGQRVLQPIINQQVGNVLTALEKQVSEAAASTGSAPTHDTEDEELAVVAVPFRIGVMQLTMEPLDEMLELGAGDGRGRDGHDLARRGVPVVAQAPDGGALLDGRLGADGARDGAADDRLGDHLAVHAPSSPGCDGCARRAGGGGPGTVHPRLRDVEDLPQQREDADEEDARADARRGRRSSAACSAETRSSTTGDTWSASVPALSAEAHTPRDVPPVYVAATAPKMQALAGEIADGCLTPSITTPAFVRYTRENVGADIDIGCTVVASIDEDRDKGRDGAREIAGMYLANKVQNIQGAADTLLDLAGLEQDEIRPVAEAMEQGGRLAAKAKVTDEILDKCKPIAGTPADCIAAIEEYRDAGCTHVMLELWGDKRHDQIRLFGEKVLPHFRS